MPVTAYPEQSIEDIRKAMGLTQAEFAEQLGERQDTISRWEKTDSEDLALPKRVVRKIMEMTRALNMPKALDVADRWRNAELMRKTHLDYLEKKGAFDGCSPSLKLEYRNILKNNLRKPVIAFVGKANAGKSTLINCQIGEKKMPADWTPTTSITVYIKHRDDRPAFIRDTVWVFKSDGTEQGFDPVYLEDEAKCTELCVGKGDADILKDYGTRQGDKYSDDVVAAVVYLDSPILKNADLVDLPGFGTGDREADETATRKISEYADVVVFLSLANDFLPGESINALRYSIQRMPVIESTENGIPPLGNLFVVATQAFILNNEYSLADVLQKGRLRFEKTLPTTAKEFFEERGKRTGYANIEKHFQDRFFTYTSENPEFRERLENELRALVEKLPGCVMYKTRALLLEFSRDHSKKLEAELQRYFQMQDDTAALERDLELLQKNEPARKEKSKAHRKKIMSAIQRYLHNSVEEFHKAYDRIINVDFIVDVIKQRGFKKNKGDMELLVNHLGAKLESEADKILSKYSVELMDRVDDYLGEFENFATIDGKIGINASIPFDARRVFLSGMAGLVTFGGLAIWASTLGNLAGYIIVAKGVSLLSALGLSLGGTAAVMPFVAAIGGPITLFIAAAVLVGGILFGALSGGWQKRIAEKLVAEYEKARAKHQYSDFINDFWADSTAGAFNKAADAMEKEWLAMIDAHKAMLDDYDEEDIRRRIKEAEAAKSFLANIPLHEGG